MKHYLFSGRKKIKKKKKKRKKRRKIKSKKNKPKYKKEQQKKNQIKKKQVKVLDGQQFLMPLSLCREKKVRGAAEPKKIIDLCLSLQGITTSATHICFNHQNSHTYSNQRQGGNGGPCLLKCPRAPRRVNLIQHVRHCTKSVFLNRFEYLFNLISFNY